jgi:hypothetical protein
MNKFLKLKFENFDDKDEKKIFVNRKLESIKEIINKANNGIKKAFEVYQKYKGLTEILEYLKINFLADYILLDNDQLKQKYNFLTYEDLKIEPKPVENIIEVDNIINNNP